MALQLRYKLQAMFERVTISVLQNTVFYEVSRS